MTFDTVPQPGHDASCVDEPVTIGELIQARREAAGLSKAALARDLGTSYQRIILWESDKHAPSPEYADALAGALGGTPADYMEPPYEPLRIREELVQLRSDQGALADAVARLGEGVRAIADSVEALDRRVRALEGPHSAEQQSQ